MCCQRQLGAGQIVFISHPGFFDGDRSLNKSIFKNFKNYKIFFLTYILIK